MRIRMVMGMISIFDGNNNGNGDEFDDQFKLNIKYEIWRSNINNSNNNKNNNNINNNNNNYNNNTYCNKNNN